SVDAHFHATDPQPFVAEAGNKTELDETLRFDHGLDDARQNADPRMHAAFLVNLLIGTHGLGVAHDIVDRRHAALEALLQSEDNAVLELEIIELRGDLLENQLRPLV